MKIEQLRLDFSDYSAKEQEKDAMNSYERKVPKHVYLMKIDGVWSHYIINLNGEENYDFHPNLTLTEVFRKLKTEFPNHSQHVLQNKGLEDYLRDKRKERSMLMVMPKTKER